MIYLLIALLNISGFMLMGYDKVQAQRRGRRIPEATFFFIAFIGGTVGVFMGMQYFRHKTKHFSFMVAIPLLFMFNVAVAYFFKLFPFN